MTKLDLDRMLADPEIPDRAKDALREMFSYGVEFAVEAFRQEWSLFVARATTDRSWHPGAQAAYIVDGILARAMRELEAPR